MNENLYRHIRKIVCSHFVVTDMMITNKSARIFDVVCARQMIVYLLYEYQFQVLEICELMSLSSNTVYHSINVARNKLQNKSYVAFKEKYQLIKQNFNNQ